jgi:phosphatidylinositol dimannoside acyltransferase
VPVPPQKKLTRRLGVFGDLPSRLSRRALISLPWFLEPVLTFGWSIPFFLIAKSQRRAVVSNLLALHPTWGRLRAQGGAFQVFWNFARTYADGLRCETGTGNIDWAIDGKAALDDLGQRTEGCIILTAHMGNYDIAAPMFTAKVKRTLYAVRAPEREPEMQRIREEELRKKEALHPHFRTLYNQEGNLLGVELARLIHEGNMIAVQGDRVIFDVSPMDVEVETGLKIRLPKGPLFLARATGAPCFPLFIIRDGWRRYRVKTFPPLELPPRRRGVEDESEKIWAAAILSIVRQHWKQWFVFEPALTRIHSEKTSD